MNKLTPEDRSFAVPLTAGLGCDTLRRPWPPPIPTMPCFKCGGLTNETQSVFGVGHDQCFRNAHVHPNVKLTGSALLRSPVERRVGGEQKGRMLNIFAGCELTDEIREELEQRRAEAIRIEMQESNAA